MKKRKKEKRHESKAVALFLAAVLVICGFVVLRDPRVVGYAIASEQKIEVLNKQSYTAEYNKWVVMFKTEGDGELDISDVKDSFYSLGMPEIKCGNKQVSYEQKNGMFIVKNYKCDVVSTITMEVRSEGLQKIKLVFGNKDYASNTAMTKEKI